jgi:hypothetical protein
MEDIPQQLIINWDQTGIHYVPVSNWTLEKEASKELKLLVLMIKDKLQRYLLGQWQVIFSPHS